MALPAPVLPGDYAGMAQVSYGRAGSQTHCEQKS
jgi:hypothetical protein